MVVSLPERADNCAPQRLTHLTLVIAGIFGANPVQIPKIKLGQMGENNSSSVQGGAPHPANHRVARLPGSQACVPRVDRRHLRRAGGCHADAAHLAADEQLCGGWHLQ